uniref:Uncharacterized protein n=1 Tax=Avena sativa TaxID=4498 RepID=A0ACD5XC07_AVESA
MILRPSNGTYDMVELPGEPCGAKGSFSLPTKSVLASYERGIHYVAINQLELQVWMLTTSTDGTQLGWTLFHHASLNLHCHAVEPLTIQPRVAWGVVQSSEDELVSLFEDSNYGSETICGEESCENDMTEDENYGGVEDGDEDEESEELIRSRGGSEDSWNSDEDNFIDVVEGATHLAPLAWGGRCEIMGFHPHKWALILVLMRVVVVYHIDTSRIQYLGDVYELVNDNVQAACSAYAEHLSYSQLQYLSASATPRFNNHDSDQGRRVSAAAPALRIAWSRRRLSAHDPARRTPSYRRPRPSRTRSTAASFRAGTSSAERPPLSSCRRRRPSWDSSTVALPCSTPLPELLSSASSNFR